MEGVLEFISHGWAAHSNTILTCLFWAGIGYAVTLPMSFFSAVYNTVKIGATYDSHGTYSLGRRYYRRGVKVYGLANLGLLIILAVLIW